MTAKPKRRWFQFSLRTLLALTTIAGFGLGYVGYERRLAQQQHEIEVELRAHGMQLAGGESQRPEWLKQILGDDSAGLSDSVQVGTRNATKTESPAAIDRAVTQLKELPKISFLNFDDKRMGDEGLAHFRGLTQIQSVWLHETQITDRGLCALRELKSLKTLNLVATQTGDAGLKEISRHQDLEVLWLGSTKVTAAGLRELQPLKKLRWLSLNDTTMTDADLSELRELQSLEMLGLGGTLVTDAGLRELRPLKNLTQLDIRRTKVTDAGLRELENHAALQSVDVYGNSVTLPGIWRLKKALPDVGVHHSL